MIFPFPFFFKKKIEVQSIYDVVLVLGGQQSDSVIHVYIYIHCFPDSFTLQVITGYQM